MNKNDGIIASLVSALLWFPVGMILGALSIREYERIRGEEIAYRAEKMGETLAPPTPPDVPAPMPDEERADPADLTVNCDLCGNDFEVPHDTFGEVECPHCENNVML